MGIDRLGSKVLLTVFENNERATKLQLLKVWFGTARVK